MRRDPEGLTLFTSDTHRAQRIRRLLRVAEEHGLRRGELLAEIGLTEAEIRDPDQRVPISKAIHLWQLMMDWIGDPDLGLKTGATIRLREAGVVGYAMMHSATLLGAARRVVRYARLLSQRLALELHREGRRWSLCAAGPPVLPKFRPPIDEGLAGILTVFRELAGRELSPAEVRFSYPKPADLTEHRRLFGRALRFDQPDPAILLWDRDMQAGTQAADPQLTRYLDELADIRLQELPCLDTWRAKVEHAVWPHLCERTPSIREIAPALALSRRSLQRRLREEGTSYAEVVKSLRREKARLLLRDPHLAIYEVGYLLGYSDPSAFSRAFRRWNGRSPGQYRAETVN